MELFVTTVNGWKPLTILTKSSILDVARILDPPLKNYGEVYNKSVLYCSQAWFSFTV